MEASRPAAVEFLFAITTVVFTCVFFANAWVVDDAYITFRTIDNFVNGYGLTWNVDERVQAYTHPLWMLVNIPPYFLTHEVFYTVIVVCFVCCLGSILLYRNSLRPVDRWKAPVLVVALLASRAFMDYSSSGLENCLSALWAVVFVTLACDLEMNWREITPGQCRRLLLVASAAYVTRQDTVLLYLPACALVVFAVGRRHARAVLRPVVAGVTPAAAWTAFAIVYYGFAFPNTAYAKALVEGLTFEQRVNQGIVYCLNELLWDPWTWLILLLCGYAAVRWRRPPALALWAGVLLYLIYIIGFAAVGTHQAGRFFSVPFAVAALTLLASLDAAEGTLLAAAAVGFLWVVPASPVRTMGCSWTPLAPGGRGSSGVIDTRYFVCVEGAALANFSRMTTLPDHAWMKDGLAFRGQPQRVRYGGAVGYFGYAAGPSKVIIDIVGLTDPLLARLPAPKIAGDWIPGHFERPPPAGYPESLEANANQIVDPDLHQYYDSVRLITRGRLFSVARWREIAAMNTGRRQYLVRRYQARLRRQAAP